jgi:DNA-binding beta-propeller fold protein YncE
MEEATKFAGVLTLGCGRVISGALGFLIALILFPTVAWAAGAHPFLGTFGSASQPSFAEAQGMAVDQSSGDLLVIDGAANTVSRWHADGTPSNFSALGTNVIDGLAGGDDETPQGGLSFGDAAEVQIAVANSGGATDGNIYVPQARTGPLEGEHLVDIFGEDGTFLGQLTDSSEGAFVEPCGIAVDEDGSVYVGDFSGAIHKYEPAASPPVNGDNSDNFPFALSCTLAAGAGPTDGFIFPAHFSGSVAKLDSMTGAEEYEVALGENTTVTVDPASGNVYAASGGTVREFDASGATEAMLLSSFSTGGGVRGIAVDETTGNVYVARSGNANVEVWGPLVSVPEVFTEPVNPVATTTATLNGSVNPNGAPLTKCFFEWGETTAYGQIAPCEDPGFEEVGEGSSPVPVNADISGLEPGTEYHFQLVAANASNAPGETIPGGDEAFLTLGPLVKAESVSQVTASGARISGEINPNGKATTFAVQYVTEAQFLVNGFIGASEAPIPAQAIGSESKFEVVVQQLGSLAAHTAYRFRLVATNPDATALGVGGKFTTFALPSTDLPDGRAYEMVSPAQKTGEVIPPEPSSTLGGSCGDCLPGASVATLPMQTAPDGDSVLYEGQPFSGGLAAGPNEYVSGRTESDWSTGSLSTPTTTGRYEAFSSDLSLGVLFQTDPALSPEAPTQGGKAFPNFYLRGEDESFEPLITVEPPEREPFAFRIRYAGANPGAPFAPGFSHLLLEANDALTPAVPGIAPAAPEVEAGGECAFSVGCNLYEWAEGELRLVNVLPGNVGTASDAVIGSGRLLAPSQLEIPVVDHAISDDGSRIFWTEEESGQVFVRVDGEETLEVPGPGSCKKSVLQASRACFLGASADSSTVLLSDGQLFELDEGAEAYEPVADLTEGEGGFEGILGASKDLTQIYFIDTADLTGGEENDNGEEAEAGELNLYAWGEGSSSFIGVLLQNDNGFGFQSRYGTWKPSRPNRTAQVSPGGRYLVFMSQASLTGYDNSLGGGGVCAHSSTSACREVFLYEAISDTLICVSCNPSGQRPIGPSNLSLLRPELAPFPQPSNLSKEGDGRLFFESQDALLPQDTNGSIQDIYQWEPNGVGTCEQVEGCLSLISSGRSANDSMFLDSTPSGDDAFFITREQLLPRDKDSQLDLYDARVGGGFEETTYAPCNPEACAGSILGPSAQPSAATSQAVGPPNPPVDKPGCKKGFVKKNGKCVKKPKKKKKAKRASNSRGGSK